MAMSSSNSDSEEEEGERGRRGRTFGVVFGDQDQSLHTHIQQIRKISQADDGEPKEGEAEKFESLMDRRRQT